MISNKFIIMLVLVLFTVNSNAADTWSACVNITSVSDARDYNNSVWFSTSPALACDFYPAAGGPAFSIGKNGLTADSIKGKMAVALAAQVTKSKVTVYYTKSDCSAQIIALNGYSGQCN